MARDAWKVGEHEIAPVLGQMNSFPDLEKLLQGMTLGEEKETELTFPGSYRHEALALMQAVAEGRTEDPRMTPAESIEVLEIMDAARAAWSAQA